MTLLPTTAETILATISDLLFLVTGEGKIQRVNRAVVKALGYEEAELVGQDLSLIFPEAPTSGSKERSGGPGWADFEGVTESVLQPKHGGPIRVSISGTSLRDPAGTRLGAVLTARDQSDLHSAVQLLSLLDKAIQTTRTGITIKNREGYIMFTNQAEASMHGYRSARELIGLHASVLGLPEARQSLSIEEMVAAGGKARETINLRKDGSQFPAFLISDIVRQEDGRPIGVVTTCEDITSRKQAEAALRETTTQLIQAEKLAALGELEASMAHELRQPLNGIKIIVQSVLRYLDSYDRATLHKDLGEVVSLVDTMSTIIDHMREYVRKTGPARKIAVDLNTLVDRALQMVGQQLKNHDVELLLDLTPALPSLQGDPIRLEQVILNLLVNAQNALEGAPRRPRRIEVRTRLAGQGEKVPSVILEVLDNGMGIPEDLRPKIFTPFFTTKEPGKGTGLGLSISRTIVTDHHGLLEFDSRAGEGSTFRVTLPIRQPPA